MPATVNHQHPYGCTCSVCNGFYSLLSSYNSVSSQQNTIDTTQNLFNLINDAQHNAMSGTYNNLCRQTYVSSKGIPTELVVGINPDVDAIIAEFVVGRISNSYVCTKYDCYLSLDDLPENLLPPASMLKAAFDSGQQNSVKLAGVGSARRLTTGDVFYFRVCI